MSKRKKALKEKKKRPVRQLKKKRGKAPSTQRHVPFAEIRDGIVIMKDGTLRVVILVSSINFALKSEDEQKGIIQGYVSFLNSITYELQIVVQSRRLNIEKYLAKLDTIARQQDNELLRKQTKSYRSFVKKLVVEADIMDKKFFVVVPFSPYSNKKKSFWTRLQEVLRPAAQIQLDQARFEKYKVEMERRISMVLGGLSSMGLEVQMLDTRALIELYSNTYNPSSKQRKSAVEDIDSIQVDQTVV